MATFEPIRDVDFHHRIEDMGGRPKRIQLAVHQYTARHPLARDPNRVYLTRKDVRVYGNERNGQFVIVESVGWALVDLARRTQQYLLACGNGITRQDLLTWNGPLPSRIDPLILRQLRMPRPMLFEPSFFQSNLHGSSMQTCAKCSSP